MAILSMLTESTEPININDLLNSKEIADLGITFIDRGMDDGVKNGTPLDGVVLSIIVEGYNPTIQRDENGAEIGTKRYGQAAAMVETPAGVKKATLSSGDIVSIGQQYRIMKYERMSKQGKPVPGYNFVGRTPVSVTK